MDYSSFTARDLARLDPPGDPDNIAERASDAAFARSVEIVREANSTLSRRGGKLVLVRLPMSGNAWDVNRETLPKTQYWEKLAAETGAETIHWTEIPGLPEMSCRDGSHLDYRDAEVFTRYLLAELDRRGLLPAKSEPSGV